MTQPMPEPVSVILCDEEVGGRIVVDLEAFIRFTSQIDAALSELEAKWVHLAPPRSDRRMSSPDRQGHS